jgi:hypothetical protein
MFSARNSLAEIFLPVGVATIKPRADDETASVGGVADQVDDNLVGPHLLRGTPNDGIRGGLAMTIEVLPQSV